MFTLSIYLYIPVPVLYLAICTFYTYFHRTYYLLLSCNIFSYLRFAALVNMYTYVVGAIANVLDTDIIYMAKKIQIFDNLCGRES